LRKKELSHCHIGIKSFLQATLRKSKMDGACRRKRLLNAPHFPLLLSHPCAKHPRAQRLRKSPRSSSFHLISRHDHAQCASECDNGQCFDFNSSCDTISPFSNLQEQLEIRVAVRFSRPLLQLKSLYEATS